MTEKLIRIQNDYLSRMQNAVINSLVDGNLAHDTMHMIEVRTLVDYCRSIDIPWDCDYTEARLICERLLAAWDQANRLCTLPPAPGWATHGPAYARRKETKTICEKKPLTDHEAIDAYLDAKYQLMRRIALELR